MNPIPTLTLHDYTILRDLIKNNTDARIAKEVNQLSSELNRAIIDKTDTPIAETIIKINSQVEVQDIKTGQKLKITIVLPRESNVKEGKISVFAPLSIALIGFNKNDEVVWEMPSGVKNIKIVEVIN